MEQEPRPAHPVLAGLLALAGVVACASPPPVAMSIGPTVVPSVGLAAGLATEIREAPWGEAWLEAEYARQWLDDEDFADDDNPPAGDWSQLRAGIKLAFPGTAGRRWTARGGLVWAWAREHPNVVDEPGAWHGAHLALGFETRLGRRWWLGPELALLVLAPEDGGRRVLVPQATWRLSWGL